jgi:hypothetical protein
MEKAMQQIHTEAAPRPKPPRKPPALPDEAPQKAGSAAS